MYFKMMVFHHKKNLKQKLERFGTSSSRNQMFDTSHRHWNNQIRAQTISSMKFIFLFFYHETFNSLKIKLKVNIFE